MRNILVVCGMYLPTPSANGACLDAILKKFYDRGYFAHVITMNVIGPPTIYTNDYCKVYPVVRERSLNPSRIINRIKSAFYQFRFYPLVHKRQISDVYKKCVEILNENSIDFILCVQLPASSGYIGTLIKHEKKRIPVVLYELDSLTDNHLNHSTWTKYFSKRNFVLEEKIYKRVDLIMHMRGHSSFYEKPAYVKYKDKSVYVDIPLIEKEVYVKSEPGKSNCHRLIYSGVLMKEFRSPFYLIDLFAKVLETEKDLILEFYSRGNCEDYLREKMNIDLKGHLFANGYISKQELDDKCSKCDVLVSIGNSFNDKIGSLPSKILYYMSLGKPIIHIAPNKSDLCVSYLERYPRAVIIHEGDSIEENVEKFVRFTKTIDGSIVDFEKISEEFKENTAEYTVDVIMSKLNLHA